MVRFAMRRGIAAAGAISLVFGVTAGRAQQAQEAAPQQVVAAKDAEISIQSFHFVPPILTVQAGTAVTWVNHDEEPHNVVSLDRVFRSKAIDGGEKFTAVFDKPGTYNYICAVHPQMRGQIVVQ